MLILKGKGISKKGVNFYVERLIGFPLVIFGNYFVVILMFSHKELTFNQMVT